MRTNYIRQKLSTIAIQPRCQACSFTSRVRISSEISEFVLSLASFHSTCTIGPFDFNPASRAHIILCTRFSWQALPGGDWLDGAGPAGIGYIVGRGGGSHTFSTTWNQRHADKWQVYWIFFQSVINNITHPTYDVHSASYHH